MNNRIAMLPGDGIGDEIMQASVPLMYYVANARGHKVVCEGGLVGFAAYDAYRDVMPEQTWDLCRRSSAILFGAVGLPHRDAELPPDMRPERRALLPIRKEFGLSINIRPVRIYPGMEAISPLKERVIAGGVHLTFFRELTGGGYFGERRLGPPAPPGVQASTTFTMRSSSRSSWITSTLMRSTCTS